jgi:CrcB protein
MMVTALWVAALGAVGSVLRWLMGGFLQRAAGPSFPWGTFAVNALGSFAIGVVMATLARRGQLGTNTHFALVTGLLGGFTTMSAFAWETFALVDDGHLLRAGMYLAGTVVVCIGGCAIGAAIVRAL